MWLQNNPKIFIPDDGEVVWQYMPLAYFENLIATKSLYFKTANNFYDGNEGLVTRSRINKMRSELSSQSTFVMTYITEQLRNWIYVSCWHSNQFEAFHMWAQYGKTDGIAIQTTVKKLKAAITDEKHFSIGSVQYINRNTDDVPTTDVTASIFYKALEYRAENEIRLMHMGNMSGGSMHEISYPKDQSLLFKTDLNLLFEKLIASPNINFENFIKIQKLLNDAKIDVSLLHPSNMKPDRVWQAV